MANYVSLVEIKGKIDRSLPQAVKSTRSQLAGIQTPLNALSSFSVRDVESAVSGLGDQGKKAVENLGNMIPGFKGVGIAAAGAIATITGVTTALVKLGGEAHTLNDIATSSSITTQEFRQLDFSLQGVGNNSEKVAHQIARSTTSIADSLAHPLTQGEALRKLFEGFAGVAFNVQVFRDNDPFAVLEEVRRAVEQGATDQQIRTGLSAAGYTEEAVTEILQLTATAQSWETHLRRISQTPPISQDQIDQLARLRTGMEDLKDNVLVGVRDEFYQLSQGAGGFGDTNQEVLDGLELLGRFSLSTLVGGFKVLTNVLDAAVTSISMFVDAGKIGVNQLGKAWNDSRIGVLGLQNTWFSTQDAILAGIEKIIGAATLLPDWAGGDKASEAQAAIANIRANTQASIDENRQARAAIQTETDELAQRNQRIRGDIQDRGDAFISRFQNNADEVATRFNRDIARTYGSVADQQRYDEAVRSFETGGSRDILANPNYGREPAGRQVTLQNTYEITANSDVETVLRQIEESQLRQVQELVG